MVQAALHKGHADNFIVPLRRASEQKRSVAAVDATARKLTVVEVQLE